jgi:hypothetical protein
VDISDIDEIVRNYDFSKVGDVEYHKRFGEQANYFCLGLGSIDNLSNKILVRCLIVQNRLVNGVNKDYENALYDYSEGQQLCAFMKAGNYTYEQAQEVVNKALNGDRELLSRLQDLPYLNPKYRLKE